MNVLVTGIASDIGFGIGRILNEWSIFNQIHGIGPPSRTKKSPSARATPWFSLPHKIHPAASKTRPAKISLARRVRKLTSWSN